jgi:hypothetical protein
VPDDECDGVEITVAPLLEVDVACECGVVEEDCAYACSKKYILANPRASINAIIVIDSNVFSILKFSNFFCIF